MFNQSVICGNAYIKNFVFGVLFALSTQAFAIPQSLLNVERNPKEALELSKKTLQLPHLTSDEKAFLFLEIASAASSLGDVNEHNSSMRKAQELFAKASDNAIPCIATAITATHKADFASLVESREYAKKAISCAESVTDELSRAYVREYAAFTLIAGDTDEYAKAQPLFEYARQVYKKHNIKFRELSVRFGLSRVYLSLRSSKDAFVETLAVFEETKATGIAPSFEAYMAYQAGVMALHEKEYVKAIELLQFSEKKSEALKESSGLHLSKYMRAKVYVAMHKWDEAIKLLNEQLPLLKKEGYLREYSMGSAALERALAAKGYSNADELWKQVDMSVINTPERLVAVYTYRAEALDALGRYKEAYESQKQLLAELEKMYKSSSDKRLANMASEYQLDKKEIEINKLKLEKQVSEASEQISHAKQQYWISLLVLLFSVSAFIAWRQNKFKKEALHLALTDVGTGAPNRRAILQKLELMYNLNTPCLVGIADLDHFKRINDTFGHDTGDAVLETFYASCVGVLNRYEFVGRFGGEEWLFVLPGDSLDDVQRIHLSVTQELKKNCALRNLPLDITFSLGVAPLNTATSVAKAIKDADENLYIAKHTGRNKVVANQIE